MFNDETTKNTFNRIMIHGNTPTGNPKEVFIRNTAEVSFAVIVKKNVGSILKYTLHTAIAENGQLMIDTEHVDLAESIQSTIYNAGKFAISATGMAAGESITVECRIINE